MRPEGDRRNGAGAAPAASDGDGATEIAVRRTAVALVRDNAARLLPSGSPLARLLVRAAAEPEPDRFSALYGEIEREFRRLDPTLARLLIERCERRIAADRDALRAELRLLRREAAVQPPRQTAVQWK
jgi:hypothetical protein